MSVQKIGSITRGLVSAITGFEYTVTDTTVWYDGTAMDDSKKDGVIYLKNPDGTYAKRNIPTWGIDIREFGAKADGGITDNAIAYNKAGQLPFPLQIVTPPDTFAIKTPIHPTSNKRFVGFGEGSKIYSSLISTDPGYGHNFFEVINQQNVSISAMYLNGTYNAGTALPPTGVVSGQGVTACFAGCKNVRVEGCKLDNNGRGSGSVYFSKCIDAFARGNTIERSTNGVCADNYYGPSDTLGGAYCYNVIIDNNIIVDCGGRGVTIDCMESAAINSNFTITGNIANACGFAGIQCNARGAVITNNIVDCKRDEGHSTRGGQQSYPTLYGIYSDLGCENLDIRGNKVLGAKEHALKTQYAKNVNVTDNTFSLCLSYKDQTIGFADVFPNDSANIPIFFNWVDNLRGNPETILVADNTLINPRLGGPTPEYSPGVSFNDTSGDTTMADNTNFIVSGNNFNFKTMQTGVNFFHSASGKRGDVTVTNNIFNCIDPVSSLNGISAGSLANYTIMGNTFINVANPIITGRAKNFTSKGNSIQGYVNAYTFGLANVAAEIDFMVCADTILGPTTGGIFNGSNPNPYVVTHSDGSGMRFVGIGTSIIRNTYYPAYIVVNEGYSAVPTTGRWTAGDVVVNNAFPITDNTFVKEWHRRTTSTNNTSNSNNSTTGTNFTTDWVPDSVHVNGMGSRKYQTSNRDALPYATGFNNQGSVFQTLAGASGLPASEPFLTGINFLSDSNTLFWTQLAKGTGDTLWIRSTDPTTGAWGTDKRIFNQYLPVRVLTTTGALTAADHTALCDATGAVGAFNVTLPSTAIAGLTFPIKKIDASGNAVTVKGTIDGVTDFVLPSQNDFIVVQSTGSGTDYKIIGKSVTTSTNDIKLLNTVNGVNAKTTGATNIYTAIADTIITKIVVKVIAANAMTQGPSVDFGVNPGDVITDTLLVGLTTTDIVYPIGVFGISNFVPNGSTLKATINTAAVGTSMTISYDIFGYKKI